MIADVGVGPTVTIYPIATAVRGTLGLQVRVLFF